jgi:hypothetical protein
MNRPSPIKPPPSLGVRLVRILYPAIAITLIAVVFPGSFV